MVAADRLSVVLRAMADVGGNGSTSLVDRVCLTTTELLAAQGAGISLMVDGALQGTAGVSEAGIREVQELQLTLGEGPCVEAWAGGEPVLEPDLAHPAAGRWPAFAHSATQAGLGAVFAFPLSLGAIRLGVLAAYRDHPGSLDPVRLADGLLLADVATQVILGLQAGARDGELHALLAAQPAHWAEVHQATGMLAAQLGVSLDEAFVRLRAHAFSHERALREVAAEVVTRRLRIGNST